MVKQEGSGNATTIPSTASVGRGSIRARLSPSDDRPRTTNDETQCDCVHTKHAQTVHLCPLVHRLGTSFDEANIRMLATFLPSEEARKKEEKTNSSQFTTVVCYAQAQQKRPGCKKNQHRQDKKYDKTHPLQP